MQRWIRIPPSNLPRPIRLPPLHSPSPHPTRTPHFQTALIPPPLLFRQMSGVLRLPTQYASDVPFIIRSIGDDGLFPVFGRGGFDAGFFYNVEAVVQGVGVAELHQGGQGGGAETAGDGFDVVGFAVFGRHCRAREGGRGGGVGRWGGGRCRILRWWWWSGCSMFGRVQLGNELVVKVHACVLRLPGRVCVDSWSMIREWKSRCACAAGDCVETLS